MAHGADGLVVSVRSDRHGCVGALVAGDGRLLAVTRRRHDRLGTWAGFHALSADGALSALHGVLADLAEACEGRAPMAIGISTAPPTAVFVGGENEWLSPVLFGDGMPVPGRQVPSEFSAPGIATLYRHSVVRQITERRPEVAVNMRRVVSLGAVLNRELTGYWVDSAACRPTSTPWSPHSGHYVDDEVAWLAVGMDRRYVPDLVPPGGILAQLSPPMARRYGWAAGTPLLSTGDALSCAAYGLATDAAAWVVELGDGLRTGWIGPRVSAESERYSIQLLDAPSEPGGAEGEDDPEVDAEATTMTSRELSADEATWLAAQRLEGLVEVSPGPRRDLACYQLRTVEGLFEPGAGPLWRDSPLRLESSFQPLVGPQMLEAAPLGCDGVRMLASRHSAAWVGLRPGHGDAHLVRAALEGLALELGRWRMTAGVLGADRPRVVVKRPWTTEAVQWVADMLGESVLIWSGEPELPTLLGQSLAILRDLGLRDPVRPSLSVNVIEPGSRAEHYRPQRAVHLALMDALAAVI